MATRRMPLVLLLLLGPAGPARADLKITTRIGTDQDGSTCTRYIQGRNWRSQSRNAYGPQFFQIYNAGSRRFYTLDAAARVYTVRRMEPPKHTSLARRSESGKTISIYLDTVDTGERRWILGHWARHVIQSERRVSEPGSCSGGGDLRTTTDGWYIDLPAAFAGPAPAAPRYAYFGIASARCNGLVDRIDLHATGPYENGFALLSTWSTSAARHTPFRTEVTELDESPLDRTIFAPPADFHLVLFLPNQRPYSFLDTLRYGWARFMDTAEALLN